jgi:hypothetical protein
MIATITIRMFAKTYMEFGASHCYHSFCYSLGNTHTKWLKFQKSVISVINACFLVSVHHQVEIASGKWLDKFVRKQEQICEPLYQLRGRERQRHSKQGHQGQLMTGELFSL